MQHNNRAKRIKEKLSEFSFYRIWQRKDHRETIIHEGDRTQLKEAQGADKWRGD